MKSTDRIKKLKQTNNNPTNKKKKKNHNKPDIWAGFSWFWFGFLITTLKANKPQILTPNKNNKCNVISKPNSWLGTQECRVWMLHYPTALSEAVQGSSAHTVQTSCIFPQILRPKFSERKKEKTVMTSDT